MTAADRLAILEQLARYAYAWDGKDADAYAQVFAEDGAFEVRGREAGPVIRREGRAAIREWARGLHSGNDPGLRPRDPAEQTRHFTSGTVFEALTTEEARTRTMLWSTFQRPADGAPRPSTTGVYADRWRRSAEGWRIVERVLQQDNG